MKQQLNNISSVRIVKKMFPLQQRQCPNSADSKKYHDLENKPKSMKPNINRYLHTFIFRLKTLISNLGKKDNERARKRWKLLRIMILAFGKCNKKKKVARILSHL